MKHRFQSTGIGFPRFACAAVISDFVCRVFLIEISGRDKGKLV